jgi:uncharacterized protein (TIRG00374 family)
MSLSVYRNMLLAVSAVLLVTIIALSKPDQIYAALLTARADLVAAALGITTFTALLRVFKWSFLLKAKFTRLVPVQFFGVAVSIMTPGRVAEPTKALILKIRDGIPVSKSLPSIIWERIVDIIAVVLFAAVSLTAFASSKFSLFGYIGVAVFSGLIIVLVMILHSERFGMSIFYALRRLPFLKKIDAAFVKSFYSVHINRDRVAAAFIAALVIWLLDGVALWLVAQAFGISIDPLAAVGIVALATMIGVASSLPGGLGSTEIVMVILLTAYGAASPVAVTTVFVYRFITIWYGLLLGLGGFVYLGRKMDFDEIRSMILRNGK